MQAYTRILTITWEILEYYSPELATQYPDERSLELPAGTRIDDGVHHGIAIAQPEDHLEQPARDGARQTQGLCNRKTKYALITDTSTFL